MALETQHHLATSGKVRLPTSPGLEAQVCYRHPYRKQHNQRLCAMLVKA